MKEKKKDSYNHIFGIGHNQSLGASKWGNGQKTENSKNSLKNEYFFGMFIDVPFSQTLRLKIFLD